MRIAITGTQGTGKTTLLKKLREIEPYKSSYTFVTELTRKLHEKGYPINEQGTDEVQRILAQQCVEASLIPNSIADRCVLDNIVFTTFLFNEGKVNQETMNDAIEKFEANISFMFVLSSTWLMMVFEQLQFQLEIKSLLYSSII